MWTFQPVDLAHRPLVHEWLISPHAAEWFYDEGLQGTLRHLDQFLQEKPTLFCYWLAFDQGHPFAFFITSYVSKGDEIARWCSDDAKAITLDMLIGDTNYMGKGLAHLLIQEFLYTQFPQVDEVLIDPEKSNTRAIHVYEKAGFKTIGEFTPPFPPHPHLMMRLTL